MDLVFEELIQNIPSLFYRCKCDKDWTMLFMSDYVEELTGYSVEDFVVNNTITYAGIIHKDDADYAKDVVARGVENKKAWILEHRIITKDGVEKWISEKGIGIYSDTGELLYLDGFIFDITDRKEMENALVRSEKQVRDLAYTDTITGLPNRNLFTDRLDQLILISQRYQTDFALMFIDLDRFKYINDNYGHLVGDKLLCLAAERISSVFRKSDTVARFGGDEFLVIMPEIDNQVKIEKALIKLIEKMAEPYYVDDHELCVTGSIGVVLNPGDGTSSTELLKYADIAMYEAKRRGKNQFVFFTEELQVNVFEEDEFAETYPL